jgi:RND family efflux transporter MFP subunit
MAACSFAFAFRPPCRPAAVTMLALALAACDAPVGARADAALTEHVMPVRVAQVEAATARRELRLPGMVRSAERAAPAFLHAGHLAERFVVRGERVAAGQRLASLQNPALGPALAAAEARVRELDERLLQLTADHERARELYQRGLASTDLLDRTLAERNATREARAQALAAASEARDQLADAVLRAPFEAIVSDLLIEPGDFVMAGQPVLVLTGNGGLEVEVQLPEGLARELVPGESVTVRAVASGGLRAGSIREIGVARQGRPAPAIIALAAAHGWDPGLSVHVTLDFASEPALTVPLGAIIDPGTGRTRLFRVVDGRAELVQVMAGRLVGSRVEVAGPLAPGDLVVVAGHQQLLDGEAVRILP